MASVLASTWCKPGDLQNLQTLFLKASFPYPVQGPWRLVAYGKASNFSQLLLILSSAQIQPPHPRVLSAVMGKEA